jgi:hypothetical protein
MVLQPDDVPGLGADAELAAERTAARIRIRSLCEHRLAVVLVIAPSKRPGVESHSSTV